MPFYKDFEDKPSKRDDWRDDARTLRPGQSNGGRPSHAARNQGGMRMPGRNVEDHTMERAGFAPRSEYTPAPRRNQGDARKPQPRDGFEPRSQRPQRPSYSRPERPERPERPAPVAAPAAPEVPENVLVGRNPIREAIRSGHDIEKLLIARGELIGSAREIVGMARERRIVVQEVDRTRLDAIAPNHQGMIAFASAFAYSTVDEILDTARERGEDPFLILLDGVTDPHNLGAIIRSAECAGAHGVIVPERRAVGLTPAAVKASAGAVEHLKVARVGNMTRLIEQLKEMGIWTYAAVMEGESYDRMDLTGPIALVIGAEGEGVSRLVKEKCDGLVSLPIRGHIDSLNASVAAGILMYAVVRARDARKPQ